MVSHTSVSFILFSQLTLRAGGFTPTGEGWAAKAREVIEHRIATYPAGSVHFNLLAIRGDGLPHLKSELETALAAGQTVNAELLQEQIHVEEQKRQALEDEKRRKQGMSGFHKQRLLDEEKRHQEAETAMKEAAQIIKDGKNILDGAKKLAQDAEQKVKHLWKDGALREFIEQRERDFSSKDCKLDVYDTVRRIEAMYEEVKVNIATNTPDNYISVGDERTRIQATDARYMNSIAASGAGGYKTMTKEMEKHFGHHFSEFLEHLAREEGERMRGRLENQHGKTVERGASRVVEEVKAINKDTQTTVGNIRDGALSENRDLEIRIEVPRSKS